MLPLFRHHPQTEEKKCGIGSFCENFPMVERESMVVPPQTLVVYAPFAQWLNVVVLTHNLLKRSAKITS